MKSIVAFDFDGVLCNSTQECLVTGLNAWNKYNNKDEFFLTPQGISKDLADYFGPRRGLVRTGGQYFVLFNSYNNGEIKSEEDFESACEKYKSQIMDYEKLFFHCREILRGKNIDKWIELHSTYKNIPDNLRKLEKENSIYIVTGKDAESVRILLGHFGLEIDTSRIYDKNIAHNKLEGLKKIADKESRQLSDIVFLDDNINHLLGPNKAGCQVYMAEWGYNTRGQINLASKKNIPVVNLENWYLFVTQRGKV